MIWIFYFVFCHHCSISSWSSSPRGVWSADIPLTSMQLPTSATTTPDLCSDSFLRHSLKIIFGKQSGEEPADSPTINSWKVGMCSSALVQLLVGLSLRTECRIEGPWWHLIPRTQSLQHRLEQSQAVLLYFVKNNPVRLSCFLPLSFIPSHFIFKHLHIRAFWRCTQPRTERVPRWCWCCLVILADVWHGTCFAFQSVINF